MPISQQEQCQISVTDVKGETLCLARMSVVITKHGDLRLAPTSTSTDDDDDK